MTIHPERSATSERVARRHPASGLQLRIRCVSCVGSGCRHDGGTFCKCLRKPSSRLLLQVAHFLLAPRSFTPSLASISRKLTTPNRGQPSMEVIFLLPQNTSVTVSTIATLLLAAAARCSCSSCFSLRDLVNARPVVAPAGHTWARKYSSP